MSFMRQDGRMCANTVREIVALRDLEFNRAAAVIRSDINTVIAQKAHERKTSCKIKIPAMVVGMEGYDHLEMAKHIVKKMEEDGFVMSGKYISPTVSWDNKDAKIEKTNIYLIKNGNN